MQESGGEDTEVESDDECTKNRWEKEWTLKERVAHYFKMEVINVTSFATQMETLVFSKAKVIFFQEHKIRKKEMPRIRKRLKEKGWAIHCGPCDETGRRASAGVGVMWKEDEVKVYPERIKDGGCTRPMSVEL